MNKKILSFFLAVTAIFCSSQFVSGQNTKTDLVNQLVEFIILQQKELENQLVLVASNKDAEKEQKEIETAQKENYAELFGEALKVNNSLTAEQKAFAKANYDRLGGMLGRKQLELNDKLFQMDAWMREGLTKSMTIKLTVVELKNLNGFFQSPAGKDVIIFLNTATLKNGQYVSSFANQQAKRESNKFAKTVVGRKFLAILKKDLPNYFEKRMKEVYPKMMEEQFKLLEPTELNKLINEFVAANYKK